MGLFPEQGGRCVFFIEFLSTELQVGGFSN